MPRYLRAGEDSGANERLNGLAESIVNPEASMEGELTAADGNRGYAVSRPPKGRYENLIQPGNDAIRESRIACSERSQRQGIHRSN